MAKTMAGPSWKKVMDWWGLSKAPAVRDAPTPTHYLYFHSFNFQRTLDNFLSCDLAPTQVNRLVRCSVTPTFRLLLCLWTIGPLCMDHYRVSEDHEVRTAWRSQEAQRSSNYKLGLGGAPKLLVPIFRYPPPPIGLPWCKYVWRILINGVLLFPICMPSSVRIIFEIGHQCNDLSYISHMATWEINFSLLFPTCLKMAIDGVLLFPIWPAHDLSPASGCGTQLYMY